MKQLFIFAAFLVIGFANAQVGIGTYTPNTSAALDITSTSQGFLLPRLTYAQKTAIASPPTGLQVWCTNCGASGEMQIFNGTNWLALNLVPGSFAKPSTPTNPVATAGNLQASVAFTAPASNGGSAISSYTVTSSPGSFTKTGTTSPLIVTGLTNGTSYTFAVIATNVAGNSVASNASNAVTPLSNVTIGSQVWTNTNLNVTTYRNGDVIPQVTPSALTALTTGAWCYYANNSANGVIYGKLYNWYAVNDPRGLAPIGWHIPTDSEWTTLTNNLDGPTIAGGAMKETGTAHWASPNTGASNNSGFSGIAGGYNIASLGISGFWWSSSESNLGSVWIRNLQFDYGGVYRASEVKNYGFSVRCLRD
jgi:uncharacterized protein (TIGR02145 family)